MSDTYHRLPKDERWLEPGNPEEIGGRTTDITQIGMSIMWAVRERWPINRVPADVADALEELAASLRGAEEHIEQVIELVSRHVFAELKATTPR